MGVKNSDDQSRTFESRKTEKKSRKYVEKIRKFDRGDFNVFISRLRGPAENVYEIRVNEA